MEFLPSQAAVGAELLAGPRRELVWAGSVRCGKSLGGVWAMTVHALRRPPSDHYIVAGQSVGSVFRNLWPYFHLIGAEYGLSVSRRRGSEPMILVNDREFHVFGGNNVLSADRVQGLTAAGALIDEASLLPEGFVTQARLRCSAPGARTLLMTNTTPLYHWLKEDIWDRAEELGVYTHMTHLAENRFLDEDTHRFYEQSFTGHWRRRFIGAEWAAPGGRVYEGYRVVKVIDGTPDRHILGLDWGPAGVTAGVLLSRYPGGRWMVSREYYHDGRREGRLDAYEHARRIQGETLSGLSGVEVVVDPSAVPLLDALRLAGLQARDAGHDVLPGIITTQNALATGRLVIHESCRALLREMEAYEWHRNSETPVKANDHACDALRYAAVRAAPVRALRPGRYTGS